MAIPELYRSLPRVEDLLKLIEDLKSLGIEVVELDRSEGGRPIYGIYIGRGSARIAIVATQHGSEPAPALASTLFIYGLLEDRYRSRVRKRDVLQKVSLFVVPLANPDGYAKLLPCLERCGAPSWACECVEARLTELGEDMNRDWLALKHRATRAIHRALNDFDPHIVLDLHEFYAVSGAPPKWAHETEGFDAYVTDTPYLGISPEIMALSRDLALKIKSSIEAVTGWVTKIVRPSNGLGIYPPIYLGTHIPIEGSAKVLVETWGVGLGRYLLYERIQAHVEAILSAIELALEDREYLEFAKSMDRAYDRMVGEAHSDRAYVLYGEELDGALKLLEQHRVSYTVEEGRARVRLPQRYSRTTLFLLDREFYLNRMLGKKAVTLDKVYEVYIEKRTI